MRIHYPPAFAVKRKIAREGEILHEGQNGHRPGSHKIHGVCRKNSTLSTAASPRACGKTPAALAAFAEGGLYLAIFPFDDSAPYAPCGAAGVTLARAGCAAAFGACGITSQAIK